MHHVYDCSIFDSISMFCFDPDYFLLYFASGWRKKTTSEFHVRECINIIFSWNQPQSTTVSVYLKCRRIKCQISNFNKNATCCAKIYAIVRFLYIKYLIHCSVSIDFNLWLSQVASFNFLHIEYFTECLCWSHPRVLIELRLLTKATAAYLMHKRPEVSIHVIRIER